MCGRTGRRSSADPNHQETICPTHSRAGTLQVAALPSQSKKSVQRAAGAHPVRTPFADDGEVDILLAEGGDDVFADRFDIFR
jgi:hypothetical protein